MEKEWVWGCHLPSNDNKKPKNAGESSIGIWLQGSNATQSKIYKNKGIEHPEGAQKVHRQQSSLPSH